MDGGFFDNNAGGGGSTCNSSSPSTTSAGSQLFPSEQEEPAGVPPEYAAGIPPPEFDGVPVPSLVAGQVPEQKPSTIATTSSSSSPKRSNSRRSVQKRVVSVTIADADGSRPKSCGGEGAPPPDSWAWRKYGQKPIKGSPYPRGYYRCSSSKGCPARKQVERSRVDPTMLVVTYACDHNHPWPLPRNNHHNHHNHHHHHHHHHNHSSSSTSSPPKPPPELEPEAPLLLSASLVSSSPTSTAATEPDGSFAADLCGEDPPLMMMTDEFGWFSDVSASPPPTTETFLDSPIICGGMGTADVALLLPVIGDVGEEGELEGEEESLFAGLGELPECSVVFRRGFLERQRQGEESRRQCGLMTAAPWCGGTG